MTAPDDPVERIPDPDTLQRQLAASVRRSDLLRGLIRVARRKAAYDRAAGPAARDAAPPAPIAGAEGVARV